MFPIILTQLMTRFDATVHVRITLLLIDTVMLAGWLGQWRQPPSNCTSINSKRSELSALFLLLRNPVFPSTAISAIFPVILCGISTWAVF